MRPLTALLQQHAPRLAVAVMDQMYRDPFWMARFGDRGRRFAEEDSRYHLSYLAQALEGRDAAPLVSYARWVQGVLTSRGMCTRHLQENLRRLGEALVGEGFPETAEALTYLEAAVEALRYQLPEAREIQLRAQELAQTAVDRLLADPPPWPPAQLGRAPLQEEAQTLLSYVADAIASGRPGLFATHVQWLASTELLPGRTAALLEVLRTATGQLSPSARAAALEVLLAGGETWSAAR